MDQIYLDWERAARRADNAQLKVRMFTRAGLPLPPEQLAELDELEADAQRKLDALIRSRQHKDGEL